MKVPRIVLFSLKKIPLIILIALLIKKLDFIKIEKLAQRKTILRELRRKAIHWEEIFVKDASDVCLYKN